jgi:hypothetical protein
MVTVSAQILGQSCVRDPSCPLGFPVVPNGVFDSSETFNHLFGSHVILVTAEDEPEGEMVSELFDVSGCSVYERVFNVTPVPVVSYDILGLDIFRIVLLLLLIVFVSLRIGRRSNNESGNSCGGV